MGPDIAAPPLPSPQNPMPESYNTTSMPHR